MATVTVTERLDALARAVRAGRGVLPSSLVAVAQDVEERAGHRLRLSADHTVVALGGSTGSGKSSLVNAIVGAPLAQVDVLRPTTSEALAVVRGETGSAALLDWLGVRRRHQLGAEGAPADGLILLDLPDHDSVLTAHRLEAERLMALVDLMVWVVDPQKYADAAVHERYLRGLADHRDVVLVVLNQVDRLSPEERAACHRDLQGLLADDGLGGVPLIDASALTGQGIPELRAALDDAAARRLAATARVEADVIHLARQILEHCGPAPAGEGPRRGAQAELVEALAVAAGVPVVAEAVRAAWSLRAWRATGWPPTRWLSRFRVDPLRRLHLAAGGGGGTSPGTGRSRERGAVDADLVRTSVPPPGPAEHARARAAVRGYTDAATSRAPEAWVLAARSRSLADGDDGARLLDALDRAVAGTRVVPGRRPRWWAATGALQWVLLAVMLGGLAWLGALAGLDALQLPTPEPPRWGEVPVPTLAAVGGAVVGLLVAGLARVAARWGAARRARRATTQLRSTVAAVADEHVVRPVDEVLARWAECRSAAEAAATPAPARRGRTAGATTGASAGSRPGGRMRRGHVAPDPEGPR
ncbi:GTPase [Actinotalea subterranea]|uniref:GTPase n=1 Tax=Actinotalea subterranea TaxID=2607497 RepID=UPI0011F0528E|nr:GTPase [Actinotalea subterranea]